MASGTVPSNPHPEVPPPLPKVHPSAEVVEYGRFIEREIRRTRSHVKWVEIIGGLMTMAAGVLGFVLAVAVADAWIISAGLGSWARWVCLLTLLGGGVAYFIRAIWPVCVRQVNPVFAAYTIERGRPSLKNSLINFLLLRTSKTPLAPVIYQAVEEKAATDLAQVPVESTVDRSRVVKLGYVLVGLVALAAVYKLVSPKDPFQSVGRLIRPWADIPPPRRVTIDQVLPGDVEAFHGEFIRVSAVVKGTYADEEVALCYSTLDGQTVDQPIPMDQPAGDYRHQATLPAGSEGLLQHVEYYLRTGDAESRRYRVTVLTAPSILVKRADLEYPAYTGLAPLSQDRGDLKALEGTRVTLHALANADISSAYIDFDCDGRRDQAFQVSGRTATISFPLKLNQDGTPSFSSYQIRFANRRNQENPQPIRYSVEIVRDLPPEVAFLAPEATEVELPRNGALTIGLRAMDPDYSLSRVTLRAQRAGSSLIDEALLSAEHRGEFHGEHLFDAERLNLAVGDEVLYWAEALDNKSPQPNRTETAKRKIKIVEPVAQDQRQDQLARAEDERQRLADGDGRPRPPQEHAPPRSEDAPEQQPPDAEQPDEPGSAEQQPDDPQAEDNEAGSEDSQEGQSDEPQRGQRQPDPRIDPESNPADAIDKINEHRQEQEEHEQPQQEQGDNQQPKPQQQPGDQQGDDPQQKDQPGQENGQQGENPGSGDEPMPGGQGEEGSAGQEQQGGEGQSGTSPRPGGNPSGQLGEPSDAGEQGGDPGQQPQPGESPTEGNPGGAEDASDDQGGQPSGTTSENPSDKPPAAGTPTAQKPGEREPNAEGADPSPTDASQGQPGEERPDESEQLPSEGQGDRSRGGPGSKPEKPRPDGENEDATGGNPETQTGEPGGGRSSDKPEGSPTPQRQAKPREKTQTSPPGQKPPQNRDESAPSASNSERESDSQGEDDGDKSGGGTDGGGQSSKQPGTGGQGQNTAAEEGSSEAEGEGTGRTDDEAGGSQPADGSTCNSTDQQPGEGADSRPGGAQPGQGAQPAAPPQGDLPAGQPKPPAGEQPPDGPPQGQGSGDASQGGQPGSGDPAHERPSDQRGARTGVDPGPEDQQRPPQASEAEDADDPNLEYSRQATDLALQHLRDELAKDEPDQELLDELGWTREDMERFVRRWDEMKQAAQAEGPDGEAARRRLEEEYKSLGLRPQGTDLEGDRQQREAQHLRLRESRRSEPPPEYAEQYRAYTQGRAKAKRGE